MIWGWAMTLLRYLKNRTPLFKKTAVQPQNYLLVKAHMSTGCFGNPNSKSNDQNLQDTSYGQLRTRVTEITKEMFQTNTKILHYSDKSIYEYHKCKALNVCN